MRRCATAILTLAALSITALPGLAGGPPKYGKTDAQIIAMGADGWVEFYTGKAGDSTASQASAVEIFGKVLLYRNERLLRPLPPVRRSRLVRLRALMRAFADEMTECGACLSGGGTVWIPVRSAIVGDVEEVIGPLAGLPAKPAPARTTGQVRRRVDAIGKRGRDSRVELNTYSEPYHYSSFAAHLKKARSALTGITKEASALNRADSNRVLDFCYGFAGPV